MKLIPIYTENVKDGKNYTIFIDEHTKLTYKAYHREASQTVYWLGFFAIIIILRGFQDISFTLSTTFSIFIFVALILIGFYVGSFFYKKLVYQNITEIYLTEEKVEGYIDKGRKILKLEVWVILIVFIFFVLITSLFFATKGLILLLLSFSTFVILVALFYRFPKARFKLYINKGEKK